MTPLLLSGPAVEPVSLAEIKSYLKVETSEEDALLTALVKAARLTVEAIAARILVHQTWRLVLDCWPRRSHLRIPLSPFAACLAIRVFDAAGVAALVPAESYLVDTQSQPGRIRFKAPPPSPGRPLSGIEIDITVGYGAAPADVPEALRLAVKRLAAHWFENRGDENGLGERPPVPAEIGALVSPFRGRRI